MHCCQHPGIVLASTPPSRIHLPALRQILSPGALQLCVTTSCIVWLRKALYACAKFLFSESSAHPVPYFPFFLSPWPQAPFHSLSNKFPRGFVVLCVSFLTTAAATKQLLLKDPPSFPPFFPHRSCFLSLVLIVALGLNPGLWDL